MLKYSTKILLTVLLACMAFSAPVQKTQAMEPVSLAMMLAPIAIPLIKAAIPYVVKGAVNMGGAFFEVGIEMFNMLLFPVGLLESTLFAPWFFKNGIMHMAEGAMAMPKMFIQMLLVMPKTIGVM
jgi:hypothetical protein